MEGALAGQPFLLEPWQKSFVANLFGWQRLDEKGRQVRRFKEAMLYVFPDHVLLPARNDTIVIDRVERPS